MGMYISFATKDNNDSVFFAARLSDNIYSEISERVGPVDINDMDKFVKLTTKQLGDVSLDLNNQIRLIKERIGLTLMKRDYDVVDLQSDIEYYEELLRDLGKVLLLLDMAWENNEVLYVNIG